MLATLLLFLVLAFPQHDFSRYRHYVCDAEVYVPEHPCASIPLPDDREPAPKAREWRPSKGFGGRDGV